MRFSLTLLFFLFFSFSIFAQSERSFVSVPVSVSDREGRYIPGLQRGDFRILQDGKEQKITFFATEDEPVSVALLIDTSASTRGVLTEIRQAANDFIDLLNSRDRCMVATFDSEVKILAPFTSDHKTLEKSIEQIQTGEHEGSVVLSAVDKITREHFARIPGRKVVVLLSDGKDFGSSVSRRDLISELEESDVMIYSIFYQTGLVQVNESGTVKDPTPVSAPEEKKPEEKKKKKKKRYSIRIALPRDTNTIEEIKMIDTVASIEAVNVLQEMSDTTAGRLYMSDAPKLSQVFKRIAAEVRQQYRLGFNSTGGTDEAVISSIIVKVNRADAVVRARGKYRKQL